MPTPTAMSAKSALAKIDCFLALLPQLTLDDNPSHRNDAAIF
jgi:hypothetical protein